MAVENGSLSRTSETLAWDTATQMRMLSVTGAPVVGFHTPIKSIEGGGYDLGLAIIKP
eukprot:COSAG02_NODE_3432_length_6751_cov_3.338094_3_plen_58_part_00